MTSPAEPIELIRPAILNRANRFNRARSFDVEGALVHSMAEIVKNDSDRWGPVGEWPASTWLELKGISAHALIEPTGRILRTVPTDLVAYHAGMSRWGELESLNESFLGAEWLVPGVHDYGSFLEAIEADVWTTEQYHAGGFLYASWILEYPKVRSDRILGHSDVAGDAIRGDGKGKRDPGPGFDWERLFDLTARWLVHLDVGDVSP